MDRKPYSRRMKGERGLSKVVIVVGVAVLMVAVAVVAANNDDSGTTKNTAQVVEAQSLKDAQQAFCSKEGRFGTEAELVQKGYLPNESTTWDMAVYPGNQCGTSEQSGYTVGYALPNAGQGDKVDVIRLSSANATGYPTPFAWNRGPGAVVTSYMFDSLLWRDGTGQPIPWLATSWSMSPDGKTWKFTLRDGVRWQDGQPFTAADVVFSAEYYKSGPGKVTPWTGKATLAEVDSVSVDPADPKVVVFNLKRPFNTFMPTVAQAMFIVPKHIWEGVTEPATKRDASAYVGTGPYKFTSFESYDPSTGVAQFDANTDFFLGTPFVRQLQFVTVGDSIAALKTGLVSGGDVGSEEAVTDAALAEVAGLESLRAPGSWNRAFHINQGKGFPFNEVKFRQAIAYAIDSKDLVSRMIGDRGVPGSYGLLAPTHPSLAPNLPTYSDASKAGPLLDAIGLVDGPDGDKYREWPAGSPKAGENFTATIHSSDRFSIQTAVVLQQYLDAVGIKVDYVQEPSNASDARSASGNYDFILVGYATLGQDPDQLRTRLSDKHLSVKSNVRFSTAQPGWKNQEFIDLADQQLVEPDPLKRAQQVTRMQEIVAAEVPMISLYVPDLSFFYPAGGFTAWYLTPGAMPTGPPGVENKHSFVTGKQFGLPSGK